MFIGHIVNRDTSEVELYFGETLEELETQIDGRCVELRQELEIDEPDEDEDDPLVEEFGWDSEETDQLVSKAKYDKALDIAEELCRNLITDAIRILERDFEFDDDSYESNLESAMATLTELGLNADAIYAEVHEEEMEDEEEDDDDSEELSE